MDKDLIIAFIIAAIFTVCLFIGCSVDPINTKMVALGPEQDRMYQEICEMQEKNKDIENPNIQVNIYIVETNHD